MSKKFIDKTKEFNPAGLSGKKATKLYMLLKQNSRK